MNYYKELLKPDPRAIFIAEAGINHDGDIMKAKKMIDAAAEANADYCKFQSFKADNLTQKNNSKANFIPSSRNAALKKLIKVLSAAG